MIAWIKAHRKAAAAGAAAGVLYLVWLGAVIAPLRGRTLESLKQRQDVRRSLADLSGRGVPSADAVARAEAALAREREERRAILARVALALPQEYRADDPERAAEQFDTRRADDERRFERHIRWRQRTRGLGFTGHPTAEEAPEWLARLYLVVTFLDLALQAGVREVEEVDPLGESGAAWGVGEAGVEGAWLRPLRVTVVVAGTSEGVLRLAHALLDPDRRGFAALVAFHAVQAAPGQDRLRAEFTFAGLERAEESP